MEIDNQIENIKQKLEMGEVFQHPDLDIVCMSGSNSTHSAGKLSDIDITTVMKPENPLNVDIRSIINLGSQLRKFAFDECRGNIVPIVISTIRLEEAQVIMAEMLNPNKTIVPIHWLHYPSIEFASINEPPELVMGLLEGKIIKGDVEKVRKNFLETDKKAFSNLAGLDWLTDSFRVFITNINNGEFSNERQPDSFLKRLALHNLEYFWKWNIIRKAIEKSTGESPGNWKSMETFSKNISPELWITALEIKSLRHKGDWANIDDVINMHVRTFDLLKI